MMRFISLLTALALACALTSCGGGGSTPEPGPPSGTAATMFTQLNSLRTANGASALANNAQVAALAQAQANLNAASHSNSTLDASGKTIKQRLEAGGMTVLDWIVPVALGNDAEAVDRWTNTQVERDLLYKQGFTDMGVGLAMDGTRQRWVVIMVKAGP